MRFRAWCWRLSYGRCSCWSCDNGSRHYLTFVVYELTEDAFTSAGSYPLNQDEHILLDSLAQSFRANPSVLKYIKVVEGQVIGLPEEYQ